MNQNIFTSESGFEYEFLLGNNNSEITIYFITNTNTDYGYYFPIENGIIRWNAWPANYALIPADVIEQADLFVKGCFSNVPIKTL